MAYSTATNLITIARARTAIPSVTVDSANATIDTLIKAASRAIERYCRRIFSVQSYEEILDLDGTGSVMLRWFPVLSISRVAVNPSAVLQIQNTTSTTTLSRATVATQTAAGVDWMAPSQAASTGIVLTRVNNGVTTADATLAWASYPTMTALAAAVNALGNGWTATVQGGYGAWPTTDILHAQGALSCLGSGAQLTVHVTDLSDYQVDPETGILRFAGAVAASQWLGAGWLPGGSVDYSWDGFGVPRGARACRISYQSGFNNLPYDVGQDGPLADVAEACALTVRHFHALNLRQANTSSITIGDYSEAFFKEPGAIPEAARLLLLPYKDWRA